MNPDDSESDDGKESNQLQHQRRDHSTEKITGHRLHRSAVRPFFCCGSQVSLTSINELKDVEPTIEEIVDSSESSNDSENDDNVENSTSVSLSNLSRRASLEKSRHPPKASNTRRKKNETTDIKSNVRKKFWTQKLRGKLLVQKRSRYATENLIDGAHRQAGSGCVCTAYRKTDEPIDDDYSEPVPSCSCSDTTPQSSTKRKSKTNAKSKAVAAVDSTEEFLMSFESINFDELYPIHDIDEIRIAERRREMAEGIELGDNENSTLKAMDDSEVDTATLGATAGPSSEREFGSSWLVPMTFAPIPNNTSSTVASSPTMEEPCYGECIFEFRARPFIPGVMRTHSQVDYIHCLVPDLVKITKCSYYWGVMDRYEAERLLHNKPEGTFLLRDSAQDEFLFSVSFRRYGRSLHARIEQWNHKFSFDSHDPGVFASDTVCGLIEHYKDPSCCMFFEPMLTLPLARSFPFSLQQLSRAVISSHINYDGIDYLPLPKRLRQHLQYYHYKQKVRVRRFDTPT